MDQQKRIQAVAKFLLQSPPGEIDDVLGDLRDIIADDEALQEGISPAMAAYNLEQFVTTVVPGYNHQVILSEAGRIDVPEGELPRFLDPRSKTTFSFDHLQLEASDPQMFELDDDSEAFRTALEKSTYDYLSGHFQDGVCTVFSTAKSFKRFVIQIVANKYNPQNFWSGRWRSEYRVDFDNKKIEGKILINVHYYEQGNVQLETTHNSSFTFPPWIDVGHPKKAAEKILEVIAYEEAAYETALGNAYREMSEKTFKGLRRTLPKTQQKMDWNKVIGYKLGAELDTSRTLQDRAR